MALPFAGILLAFQAAGVIFDYRNTRNQQKMIQQGRALEKAALDANLEAVKLQSGEESLASMQQLRKNLGSQIATNAARGTASNAGTAFSLSNKSISSFNEDERMRRFNLLSKEANLRAQDVLSGLHTLQSETQLGQAFTGRLLDKIPLSSSIDKFMESDLGKRWFGESKKPDAGYGLTPMGG